MLILAPASKARSCCTFDLSLDSAFITTWKLTFDRNNLDPDVKSLVDVKIVHGSWKSDDPNRARIEEAARAYPNVKVIVAHMPEPFGTHHSKMMILLRHDDSAQVIIHTANMISRDWANLCQAVWRSPLLPLLPQPDNQQDSARLSSGAIGTGQRFKFDLLRYLKAYESRTRTLVDHLKLYDFSSIQAALIASTPSRTDIFNSNEAVQTSFGWPGLQQILRQVPHRPNIPNEKASIVLQSSSIATITEKWLSNLFRVLSCGPSPGSPFAMASQQGPKPKFNVMFPTADEIRNSLDGYESGRSIHTKIQSAAQVKQLHLLRPMFTHWSAESSADRSGALGTREALRRRAAPHIKTYIRYASESQTEIEWALMTSANLSQQAWGALPDKNQQVRICSYEIGVVVWPGLYGEGEDEEVKMVPVFGRDVPDTGIEEQLEEGGDSKAKGKRAVMGLRMPYDLPLVPYGKEEVPWCATMAHSIPDWKGLTYEGFGEH